MTVLETASGAQRSDVLRLETVSKRYGARTVLDGVSLTIPADEYVSLLGPSGSGKTVLLRVIAGFEPPDGGRVFVDDIRIDDVPAHRRGIGFVFQNFALFPHLNVFDNIAYGLTYGTRKGTPVQSSVRAIVALVGLEGLEERGVHQISGGQRQRVALARTLVTEPRLVLLDEPLGALDANLRARMQGELRAIREQLGVTFLHVTGNETEALAMGDRTIVLDAGRVAQIDTPDRIYNSPASPDVARFLNSYNLFEGTLSGDRFTASCGTFDVSRPAAPWTRPTYAIPAGSGCDPRSRRNPDDRRGRHRRALCRRRIFRADDRLSVRAAGPQSDRGRGPPEPSRAAHAGAGRGLRTGVEKTRTR